MDWIQNHWQEIGGIFSAVVILATAIVKVTPSQKDDAIMEKILKVLNMFSIAEKKPAKQKDV